jgi:myosin-crossreactive antigen
LLATFGGKSPIEEGFYAFRLMNTSNKISKLVTETTEIFCSYKLFIAAYFKKKMNSERPKAVDAPTVDASEAGSLIPDAEPDVARTNYSNTDANATDLNDSSHDFDNVDSPVPDDSLDQANDSVADRQMGMIGQMPG